MSSSDRSTPRATSAPGARHATGATGVASPPPGPIIMDRYRLVRRLGAGAFGTVWMAHDERLERDVAVKILARDRIVGGRFEREARATARLSHPAIVTLYEAAVDDEGAYLVSELVHGSTLDGLLAAGRLSDHDIVSVGIALCDALEHAHAQSVVHRDVKPSNVLIPDAPASAAQVAKLTDFGVARVLGGDALTITGDVIGTLAYMAPEQADGLQAGPAADLYSLALVVYEALSGVNPVAQSGTRRSRRMGTYLPALRRQRRDLPRELGQGVDRALRPRPRERGSLAELRLALVTSAAEVGDAPGVVAPPPLAWATPSGRTAGRGPSAAEAAPAQAQAEVAPAQAQAGPEAEAAPAQAQAGPQAQAGLAPAALGRALAAAATGAVAAWVVGTGLVGRPVPPALAGLIAAGLVLLLPRLGWAALVVALCLTAAADGRAGAAVVILVALLLPVVLLPTRPLLWSLAAGAPALGLVGVAGLAGAWPAFAGRARTPWSRAALAAIGWGWLLLSAPVGGYLPLVPPALGAGQWAGSAHETVDVVLRPLAGSGALAPALVWAFGAAVLPWLVSGRRLAHDVAWAVAWAAIVAVGTGLGVRAGHGSAAAPAGAMVGAAAAAAAALASSRSAALTRTV